MLQHSKINYNRLDVLKKRPKSLKEKLNSKLRRKKAIEKFDNCNTSNTNDAMNSSGEDSVTNSLCSFETISSTPNNDSQPATSYHCLTKRFLKFKNRKKHKSSNKNNLSNKRFKLKIFDRVSKIDQYARIIYPTFFLTFNLIYWFYYLN